MARRGRRGRIIDKDRGWNRIKREIARVRRRKPHVQVGIFGDEAAEDRGGITNVQVAAIHEFGLPPMPERSFLRATFDMKAREIAQLAKNLRWRVFVGTMSNAKALGLLGAFVKGEVQKRMSRGIPPPLDPATIRRKGSSVPLIDTGQLRGSINYEVKNV